MEVLTYSYCMNAKQYSFIELSKKCVINVADGKELGHVCDMVFNGCAQVLGLIVPGKKSLLRSITSQENTYIPWNRIIKIGSDVILVEMIGSFASTLSTDDQKPVEQSMQNINYQQSYSQNISNQNV